MNRSVACSMALALLAGCSSADDELVSGAPASVELSAMGTVSGTDGAGLRVRTAPSTTSEIVGHLEEGERVELSCVTVGEVVGGKDVWYFLAAHGGYVSSAYIRPVRGTSTTVPGCDGELVRRPGKEAPSTDSASVDWRVNGHALNEDERAVVQTVASEVVPVLVGSRAERVTTAARGSWWALKEGVWEQSLASVYGYSLCSFDDGRDRRIGPLDACGAGRAWQVGMAAIQVPNHSLDAVETMAAQLFPNKPTSALLEEVALDAGMTSDVVAAIVGSSGAIRKSWLLRVPAIGFALVAPGEVVDECITRSEPWCFGTRWDETRKFAPTKQAALQAMADLERILDALAPR